MVNDRSVDLVDWEKGEVVGRLRDMSATGIVSVSERRCWGWGVARGDVSFCCAPRGVTTLQKVGVCEELDHIPFCIHVCTSVWLQCFPLVVLVYSVAEYTIAVWAYYNNCNML